MNIIILNFFFPYVAMVKFFFLMFVTAYPSRGPNPKS